VEVESDMGTLRVAICEDVERDATELSALIRGSGVVAEVNCYASGENFLASRPAGRFDVVFLDIYMSGISGVEVARQLRESDEDCCIVFTTTSEDHRPEAFDVDADQYLVKPVDRSKVDRVLIKKLKVSSSTRRSCVLYAKGQRMDVPHDDIHFVEVQGHNCFVYTADSVIETGSSMKFGDFEALLPPPRFMRCHQSYIVNLSHVERLERDFIMKNGRTVYVRRGDLAKCRQYERELDKWRLAEAREEA